MAPIQPTLYGSKDGFISGNLDTAESVGKYISGLSQAYSVLVEKALGLMTTSVQRAARSHPDWEPYADKIIAAYVDEEFIYTLHGGTPADEQAIEDLEYGAPPDFIPQPVLRKTMLQDAPTISRMLQLEMV